MSRRSVHVERLEIRLRNVSADEARACASRLGHTLLEELAGRPHARGGDAGAAAAAGGLARGEEGGAGREELHRVVARKVAASVRGRLK